MKTKDDINYINEKNRDGLSIAVANKDLEMVNLLNDRSTNVNQENEFNPDEINLEPNQQPSTSQQQNTLRF